MQQYVKCRYGIRHRPEKFENQVVIASDYMLMYILWLEVMNMETARVFSNGGSQAVRLHKSYRFKEDEVLVNRIGNVVVLFPKEEHWQSLFATQDLFTDDFLAESVEALPLAEKEGIQ